MQSVSYAPPAVRADLAAAARLLRGLNYTPAAVAGALDHLGRLGTAAGCPWIDAEDAAAVEAALPRPTLFPPAALVLDGRPLPDWLSMLGAHFAAFDSDRSRFLGRILVELARDARMCQSPGEPLSVEALEDRLPFVQGFRLADLPVSARRGERAERLSELPAGVEF